MLVNSIITTSNLFINPKRKDRPIKDEIPSFLIIHVFAVAAKVGALTAVKAQKSNYGQLILIMNMST